MSITATNNNPVLISVDTTATTDARTDNVNPATAVTRAWRYNDGIEATVLAGASVTDYGLEFETQGGNVLTVTVQATATIDQTLLPAATTRTDALSLIGSGGAVTYTGNGTVTSTVSSGVVLTQTQAGPGDLTANVNADIFTSANGSVGALIVDQFSSAGTGSASATIAGGVNINQTGNATVTLGNTIGTTSVTANGTGIAGVQSDSFAGVASVQSGAGSAIINVTGTGSNSGIFAASGRQVAGVDSVTITTAASSQISVIGGSDNSGIVARNWTDDPNGGPDVVSAGNINIVTGVGSVVTVGNGLSPSDASQGIGALTDAATATATSINIASNGSVIVEGDGVAGINARQQAAGGTGDISITTAAAQTISITDTTGGNNSAAINAINAGSGLVTVTSASTITAAGAGAADIVGINASGNAGVTVDMTGGSISTTGARVGLGINATANGAIGDIDITALAISSVGDAVRADASTNGNIIVHVDGALDSLIGAGVRLTGGATNTIDTTAAISGATGVHVNGGTTTLTAGANITGSLFALDIASGTLVLQGTGVSNLGNVQDNGVFAVNRSDAFTISGVISGSGAVEQNGIGITNLNGANTYTGVTTVNAGTLGLNNNASLGATSAGTTANNATILAYGNGVNIAEAITLAGTTIGVAFDQTGGSSTQSGVLNGTGPLNKTGAGTLVFTATNTYTGVTNINAGTLQVDGSIISATTVASGGTLAGTGTTGAVTVQSGGTLAPGASPGILHTGDLSLQSGSSLNIEIQGAAPGVGGYDQVVVTGTVTLAGDLSTSLLSGFHPATGATLTIIDNDGIDAVVGTFANIGTTFTQGGSTYSINYAGGDGNDVVLTALNDAPALADVDPTAAYTENAAPVTLDTAPLIAVTDPDGATLVGATVRIAGGTFVGDGDVLAANTAATSITAVWDDTTETLTLSGLDSLANYQQVLQSVTFESAGDNPTNFGANPSRTLEWQLDDGGTINNLSTVQTTTLDITAVNDQPFLLNVALTAAYEPGTPGTVLSQALQTGDVDSLNFASATVRITDGFLLGDELFVDLPTDGGNFQAIVGFDANLNPIFETTNISIQSNSRGMLVLAGADTPTHYQQVLDFVSYRSTAADPSDGGTNPTRTITWQVNDGTVASPLLQTPPSLFNVGDQPQHLAAADLNGDGALDVVTANLGSNDVTVLYGDPGTPGDFITAVPFPAGPSPVNVAIGDLDGDTFLDLAVANFSGGVSLLFNDGSGFFGAPTNVAAGSQSIAVAIDDFNNDGRNDLAVANFGSDNVSVLLAQPAGGFVLEGNFATGTRPTDVAIGDFNNDGRSDLAVSNNGSDDVTILLRNPGGSFTPAAGSPFTTGIDPGAVATADLDNDGNLDLVTANSGASNVSLLFGNGSGGFGAPVTVATNIAPQDVAIDDINGDGKFDLAVAHSSGALLVLLGDGSGGFPDTESILLGPRAVALGDFDRDGALDLAAVRASTDEVALVFNNGTNVSNVPSTLLHFNEPPTIDLDQGTAGTGFTATFTENGAAVPIADTDVLITDPDNITMASASIVLTNAKPGDSLFVAGALPGGIDSSVDTSVAGEIRLTLFNAAAFADYQTALSQVRFSNSSDNPDPAARDITVTGNDGDADGPAAHATINIVPVNDAPVLGGDDLINVSIGGTAAVTTADLTATDPDNSPAQLVYTVTGTTHGSVRLSGAAASSFTQQDLVANLVSFQHDGSHDDGSFTVSLSDGAAAPQSATVHVALPPNPFTNVTGFNTFGTNTGDYFLFRDVGAVRTLQVDAIQNNAVVASQAVGRIGSDWQIDGAGNLDGDTDNDLLIHRDQGGVRELQMLQLEGGQVVQGISLGNVGVEWKVDGIGDFNHDGTGDILLRRDAGGVRQLEVLEMKNGSVQSGHIVANMGQDWQVDGVRDFTGDGTADILLHHDVGGVRFLRTLEMQNGNVAKVHDFGPIGLDWQIDAAGDFNDDGTVDILIHRDVGTSRQMTILEMSGGTATASHALGSIGAEWIVDGVGDFNNDGTDDIALHRDTGGTRTLQTLEIHDFAVTAAHILGATGLDWIVH